MRRQKLEDMTVKLKDKKKRGRLSEDSRDWLEILKAAENGAVCLLMPVKTAKEWLKFSFC